MFQILITGLCLAATSTPIAWAQLSQNALGFQPTNNLTVAKGDEVDWDVPTPALPRGWPAPPPPPVGTPPTPNDCTNPGNPVGSCPDDPHISAYLASSNCECYFQCSNTVPIPRPCSSGLYFNPRLLVCDYPASSGCTPGPSSTITVASTTRTLGLFGSSTIANKV